MKSNRNCNLKLLNHALNHADYGLVAAHILACAFGNAEDNRGLTFLSGKKDCLCPFKVVDVELAYGVLALTSLVQHIFCRN